MKFKTLIASSVALAAIAVVAPSTLPANFNPITPAQAQDVSVSVSLFYDRLGDHGRWVDYNGITVFVPINVERDWRPYTEGRWVYSRRYGWTWVSDEPFGWATYHYGRWGYSRQVGWYWVPGRKWAPAWVSWRRSGDHVAWAPLPPRRSDGDVDISININIGANDIPDYYWVAVPTRSFLEVNLDVVIIDDDRERRRIIEQTEFVGTVNVENNIVVNNVVNVQYIEENTGKAVQEVEIATTNNPEEAAAGGDKVVAVEGELKADPEAKPAQVAPVEEVAQNSPTREQQSADSDAGAAAPTDQAEQPPAADAPAATDQQAEQPPAADAPAATEQKAEQPATDAPAEQQAEQPPAADAPAATEQQAEQPPAEAPAEQQAEQPATEAPAEQQAEQPPAEAPAEQQAEQPKAEEPAQQTGEAESNNPPAATGGNEAPAEAPAAEEPPAAAEQPAQPACEPGTENCPPAQ